ncbi:hypothetical protein SLE2022_044310 [Rubroshorea leprosula]
MASLASLAPVSTAVFFGQQTTGVRSLPNMGQALFGLKPLRGGCLVMSAYKVKLITPADPRNSSARKTSTFWTMPRNSESTCHTLAGQGLALPAPVRSLRAKWTSPMAASLMMTRWQRVGF